MIATMTSDVRPGDAAEQIVYKIVPAGLWRLSEADGVFAGAPIDLADGYIHLSMARQVRETAARHFAGLDDLLLVAVAIAALDVRWEASRNGDLFPHLYGPLPLSQVRWVAPLPLGADGVHSFPTHIL
jgi:uncharacterized protein (DUF952 family)